MSFQSPPYPTYTNKIRIENLSILETNAPYFSETQKKHLLKPLKNHPKIKFQKRVNQSSFSRFLSKIAHNAGDSVSETIADIIVEEITESGENE